MLSFKRSFDKSRAAASIGAVALVAATAAGCSAGADSASVAPSSSPSQSPSYPSGKQAPADCQGWTPTQANTLEPTWVKDSSDGWTELTISGGTLQTAAEAGGTASFIKRGFLGLPFNKYPIAGIMYLCEGDTGAQASPTITFGNIKYEFVENDQGVDYISTLTGTISAGPGVGPGVPVWPVFQDWPFTLTIDGTPPSGWNPGPASYSGTFSNGLFCDPAIVTPAMTCSQGIPTVWQNVQIDGSPL